MDEARPWWSMGVAMHFRRQEDFRNAIEARNANPSLMESSGTTSFAERLVDILQSADNGTVPVMNDLVGSDLLEPQMGFTRFEIVAATVYQKLEGYDMKNSCIGHLPKQRAKVPRWQPTGYDDPDQEQGLLLLRSVVGQLIALVSTYGNDGNGLDVDAWLEYEGFNNLTDIDTNIYKLRELLLQLAEKLHKERNVYIIFDTASLDPEDECLRRAISAVLSLVRDLGEGYPTFKVLANMPDHDRNDEIFEGIAYQRPEVGKEANMPDYHRNDKIFEGIAYQGPEVGEEEMDRRSGSRCRQRLLSN